MFGHCSVKVWTQVLQRSEWRRKPSWQKSLPHAPIFHQWSRRPHAHCVLQTRSAHLLAARHGYKKETHKARWSKLATHDCNWATAILNNNSMSQETNQSHQVSSRNEHSAFYSVTAQSATPCREREKQILWSHLCMRSCSSRCLRISGNCFS